MKVKIKKFSPDAVIPYKTHNSDFCYDVVATSCEEIAPNVFKYGLGIGFQIEREPTSMSIAGCGLFGPSEVYSPKKTVFTGWLDMTEFDGNISIDLRPRSSVWKTGMVLSNCEATIDEDFTGEVSAIFYKVAPGEIYKPGDRIGQIKLGFTLPMEFVEVEEFNQTVRGDGSYGSTGK